MEKITETLKLHSSRLFQSIDDKYDLGEFCRRIQEVVPHILPQLGDHAKKLFLTSSWRIDHLN